MSIMGPNWEKIAYSDFFSSACVCDEWGRGKGKEEEKEVEKMEKLSRYGYNLHLPSSLLGLAEFSTRVRDDFRTIWIFNTHNLQSTKGTHLYKTQHNFFLTFLLHLLVEVIDVECLIGRILHCAACRRTIE